jgi:DeoR family glycerol-3-phosphate regulon repressor
MQATYRGQPKKSPYWGAGHISCADEVFEAIRNCSFDLSIIGVYGLDVEYGLVERTKH